MMVCNLRLRTAISLLFSIKTAWSFPARPADFTSVTFIARVMPVHAVIMRHAVLQTRGPIPPLIAVLGPAFGTVIVALLECGRIIPRGRIVSQTGQGTVGTVSTQKAVYTFWGTISIQAHFVTLLVASVMPSFVISRNTENRAILAKPSIKTRLTSVRGTAVMSVVVIVVRNAVHFTFVTKPPR